LTVATAAVTVPPKARAGAYQGTQTSIRMAE
jgi:hypothetical protein